MRVLVDFERSGRVRDALLARGHDAISCDILPSDTPGPHVQADALPLISLGRYWDMLIAFPPCRYLCNSGVRWLYTDPARWALMESAAEVFKKILNADILKIAVENSVMHCHAKRIIGVEQTQTIQPWQFGEDASKRTCLWLKGLPPLIPTEILIKKRYANQTESGQNKLGPSKNRSLERGTTYPKVAEAMVAKWAA